MEKVSLTNGTPKPSEVAVLISVKIDFKPELKETNKITSY
jgi:hypothetical protein